MKYFGIFLVLVCTPLVSGQCSTCLEGKCNNASECIIGCVPGYVGKYCDQDCPTKCVNNECYIDRIKGTVTCIDGCEPGYCGAKCTRACGDGCVTCDRQCGSCNVTLCPERRYGANCSEICNPIYEKCDRETGQCIRCRRGYYGDECDQKCNGCFTREDDISDNCLSGCDKCTSDACRNGYHGASCKLLCSTGCDNPGGCNRTTGECSVGCKSGYYGLNCNYTCSEHCLSGRCNITGECSKGCESGYYGLNCNNTCNEFCVDEICNRQNGVCTSGCINGYESILDKCEQYINEGPNKTVIGLSIAFGLFFIVALIVVVVGVIIRRKRRRKRSKKTHEEVPLNANEDKQSHGHTQENTNNSSPEETSTHPSTSDLGAGRSDEGRPISLREGISPDITEPNTPTSSPDLEMTPERGMDTPGSEKSRSRHVPSSGSTSVQIVDYPIRIIIQPRIEHNEEEPETQGPSTHFQTLKRKTEETYTDWTKAMVMTKATRTVLNKIIKGISFVTITGSPGEGKTTAGYMVLKDLHERGREVFDVKTPEDFYKAKETKQPVIMLNDIFGALTYDPDSMKKWQNVLSDVLALSEHKPDIKGKSQRSKNKNMPAILLICRLSVLKEAGQHMGRYKDLVLGKDNVVNITATKAETSERIKIWKCHADSYDITIDSKLVKEVCALELTHGFPHCCRLFAAMYSKNNQLNMKHFFSNPLHFLNQTMESLMEDPSKGPLMREILRNDGSLSLKSINDEERRYQYVSQAKSLATFLELIDNMIKFRHPSFYDSAAFVVCQKDPSFVISHCSLRFLNERVRLKGLTQNTIQSTIFVDRAYYTELLERFTIEFQNRNISGVLCHSVFHDDGFVLKVMQDGFLNELKQTKNCLHVKDKYSNESFLFLMTKSGSDKILRCIHEHVELTEEEQREALLGVCEHSSVSSLVYLLQTYNDINLEVTDSDNRAPLLISTQTYSKEIIQELLMRNVNVNVTDNKGRTPLHNVCQHVGDPSVVRMLLDKGADIHITNNDGDTPLHAACLNGHVDIVSLLLEKGADLNTANNDGDTPLHAACLNRHVDIVSLLLEKGADLNITNNDGGTPLQVAVLNGRVDVVSLLLEKGADLNTANNDGDTLLHVACLNGHVDIVWLLLEKGADLNTTNNDGDTPLHAACLNGHVDVVSLLLEKGADLNTTNNDGDTPLHAACLNGHVDVVLQLVEKGADFNTTNNDGITPLQVARVNRHVDVVSLLQLRLV